MVIKSQRFEFIDGLRGLAALSVVLFHLHVAIDHLIPSAFPSYLSQIFSFGYLGIQIFFVISGFVIAYSLRDIHINFAYFSIFYKEIATVRSALLDRFRTDFAVGLGR